MPKDFDKLRRIVEDLQKDRPRAVRPPNAGKGLFPEWDDALNAWRREGEPPPASSKRPGIPGPTDPADRQESAGATGLQVTASTEAGATGSAQQVESAQPQPEISSAKRRKQENENAIELTAQKLRNTPNPNSLTKNELLELVKKSERCGSAWTQNRFDEKIWKQARERAGLDPRAPGGRRQGT